MTTAIPFRKRFRIDWQRKDRRFSLRIACGFFLVYAARQWMDLTVYRPETTLKIGWIPLRIEDGRPVPCWTVFRKTQPATEQ